MGVPRSEVIAKEIEGICTEGLDWVELSEAVSRRFAKVLGFDGACWHTVDPTTLLLTGNAIQDLPEGGLPVLAACEYSADDVNKWSYLAHQALPAASLRSATQGQPALSNRYRTLLHPVGLEYELRVSFVENGYCWGAAGFYRNENGQEFNLVEERFLAKVSGSVARGYRRAMVLGLLEERGEAHGPGLVVLDGGDEVQAISPAAEAYLAMLPRETPSDRDLPIGILALTARARGQREDRPDEAVRIRTPNGEWLLVRATRLRGGSDGRLGITIEPAGPPEIAQLLMAGYGLSQREQEVAYAVLGGASTKEIAAALFISPHTVQDHLKVIFAKLGVSSRRELVASVYADHYLPNVAMGLSPTPRGWFGSQRKPTSLFTR